MINFLLSFIVGAMALFGWTNNAIKVPPTDPMAASTIVMSKQGTYGSGFFISPDGYMITNNHVAGLFSDINPPMIKTTEGKEYKARIVKVDYRHDLALMKVQLDSFSSDTSKKIFLDQLDKTTQFIFKKLDIFGFLSPIPEEVPYLQIADTPVKKGHKYTILGSGNKNAWVAKTITYLGKENTVKWQLKFTPEILPGDSGSPIIDSNNKVVGVASAVKTDERDNKINSLGVPLETLQKFISK